LPPFKSEFFDCKKQQVPDHLKFLRIALLR
jgi:hypothetical protein